MRWGQGREPQPLVVLKLREAPGWDRVRVQPRLHRPP